MARIYQLSKGQRFSYEGVTYIKAEVGNRLNKQGVIVEESTGKEVFLPSMTKVEVLRSIEEAAVQPDIVQTEDFDFE